MKTYEFVQDLVQNLYKNEDWVQDLSQKKFNFFSWLEYPTKIEKKNISISLFWILCFVLFVRNVDNLGSNNLYYKL